MSRVLVAAFLSLAGVVHAAEIIVAAASDLAPLAPALEAEFLKSTGHRVRFTFASSGSLTQQIQNGAPFDVFLSASELNIQQLAASGNVKGTGTVYALGRLALWSPRGVAPDLASLTKPEIRHVAIANPAHAPYGVAARQALERRGLWKAVEPKLVYGENVRQALQFAESGNADAVITSWTLLKGRGVLLPGEWHDPIRQTGAVVSSSGQSAAAASLLQFLTSPAGQRILTEGGLAAIPAPTPAVRSSPPPQRPPSAARRSGRRSPAARQTPR